MTQVATDIEVDAMEMTPAGTAAALTGRAYLSWSQVTTYRSCPRQFALKYVEAREPAFVPSSLLLGGAVHAGLELHFRSLLEGQETGVDALMDAYRQAWQGNRDTPEQPVRYGKGEDEAGLEDLARRMFEAFLASPESRPEAEIIAVEETITGELHEDLPPFLARVDLMVRDDDGLKVLDAKTSRSRWSHEKAVESADQLVLYRALTGHLAEKGQTVGIGFIVLTKAVKPVVQRLDPPVDDDRRQGRLVECVRPVWDAIKAGVDFPNPGPMTCPSCPYKSHCPAAKSG